MMRGLTVSPGQMFGFLGSLVADTALAADCPVCIGALHQPRGGVCRICWLELAGGRWGLPGRIERPARGIESLTTLGPYEGRLRRLVGALKFGGYAGVGAPLGRLMASRMAAPAEGIDEVVAVPLHWRRRWTRGYNQAECIARGLAESLGRPCGGRGLHRTRPTLPQTGRNRRERLVNLRGAFAADRRHFDGRRLLLVDDVVTTGATLRACARALREAGAEAVHAVAAARAPWRGASG